MNKFKFGDKVSYRSCKNAFYLQETDDIRSLIAVEKFGAIKGAVITVITNELTPRHRLGEVRRQITSI